MSKSGFTLIELIVIVGLILTLLAISALSFNRYSVKYNVEREIRQLYANLMDARMRAMQQKRQYLVVLASGSYTIYLDNDEDGAVDPTDTVVTDLSQDKLPYPIAWGLAGGTDNFYFNSWGLVNINGNIRISTSTDAEYDCINLRKTRINLGKWNGSSCINK